jgi:hypothetical protein
MTKMDDHEEINQYDLVEVIQVPERFEDEIDLGDVGVVVEKFDDKNFVIECIQPGGSYKWLKPLTTKYVRLKSKDPFRVWAKKSLTDKTLARTSTGLGAFLGAIFGALIGAALGAITGNFNGILIGLAIGLILGVLTGALTAALTVKTAGTTGGIGVGYFTGMVFGGVFGMLLGALIPASWRLSAHTEGLPVLDALTMGRFETAMLISFPLSILATIVGVWISGKNLVPRNLKERYRP